MSTTLDGTTLADPAYGHEGYGLQSVDVGAEHETADGKLHFDYVLSRHLFSLKWKGITEAQKDAIYAEYIDALEGVVVFSPPDSANTYNVLAVPGSWKRSYVHDSGATRRYDCELQLRERD